MELGNVGSAQNVYQASSIDDNAKVNSFQAKVDLSDPVDSVEFSNKKSKEKKPSLLKKAILASLSYSMPGVGQILNGQPKKAAAFALGTVATLAVGIFAFPPALLATVGIGIASAVDAVKNAQ